MSINLIKNKKKTNFQLMMSIIKKKIKKKDIDFSKLKKKK